MVLFLLRDEAVCVAFYDIRVADLEPLIKLLRGFREKTKLPLIVLLDLLEECDDHP
jgi:hypothetical protein